MTHPMPERLPSAGSREPVKDRGTAQAFARDHDVVALKVKVKVNQDDFFVDMRDLELRTGRAELEVELPEKTSFSMVYQMPNSVIEDVARIRSRYPHQPMGTTGRELQKNTRPQGVGVDQKISRLLRWQEFLEVAESLRDSADITGVVKQQNLLIDAVRSKYRETVTKLRAELIDQQDGVPVIRELLCSGNDALTFLGVRLIRDASIRAIVQRELLTASRDFRLSRDTRDLARAYLRSWSRGHAAADPTPTEEQPSEA